MKNGSQRIRTLYNLLRGGNEHPEVMSVILRLIEEDQDARRTYIHLAHMEVNLSWILDSRSGPEIRILRQVRQQVLAKRRLWFWSSVSSVIMALLLLGLGLIRYYQIKRNDLSIQTMVAFLHLDEDAAMDRGTPRQTCFVIRSGSSFTLLRGSARMTTHGQSDIVLVAPAQVEMTSAKTLKLRQGELVAQISPQEAGFTVETPGNRFIDLGTIFGISVDLSGCSELHVFSGIVAAEPILLTDANPRRLIESGEAIACTATGILTAKSPAMPPSLQKGFNRLHGIKQVTGTGRLLSTPPLSVRPGAMISDQFIQMIPERDSIKLPADLKILPPTANVVGMESKLVESTLPAGTSCSSILLHCQTTQSAAAMQTTIHFQRPILGLILTTEGLFKTDPIFAVNGMDYPTWEEISEQPVSRGCASSFKGAVDNGDLIQIKDHGRTLIIHLTAGVPSIDQLRILLEPRQ